MEPEPGLAPSTPRIDLVLQCLQERCASPFRGLQIVVANSRGNVAGASTHLWWDGWQGGTVSHPSETVAVVPKQGFPNQHCTSWMSLLSDAPV